MTTSMELRVIVFQECDMWVAQALELDIGAQGKDLEDVRRRFDVTLHAEIAAIGDADPVVAIGPAPAEFFKRWDARSSFAPPATDEYQMALCA